MIVPDRRSYGDSPDGDGDFERDAEDIAALIDDGTHLLGNSYGGLVSLLAAARRPDAVRSLAVIEPPALGLVRGEPAVEEFIARVDAARRDAVDGADYGRRFFAAFGFTPQERAPDERERRGLTAAWRERPPWEAELPLDELRRLGFPILVVRGAWDVAPPEARRVGMRAMHAVCDLLVERVRGEGVTIPGAAHAAHRAAPFNDLYTAFVEGAAG